MSMSIHYERNVILTFISTPPLSVVLNVSKNRIKKCRAVADLTGLKALVLSDNGIGDADAVASLSSLTALGQ